MSDMVEQMTLWGEIMPFFKLKEPVILLEMFAGIGAQHKALSILNVKIDKEKSKICEWAYNSYCGYNAIHIKDKTDYSEGKSKEELIERVKGTSINYNEPIKMDQLKKKPIEWLKNAYNNCVATHNLVNIMEVKGCDLGELSKDQTSILTYSFPCQDLSLAGKGKGMAISQKEGGTRSGLLWEVERLLLERERDDSTLPTILLMENVPEVVGKNNIEHFKKWEHRLRQFGYSNYVEILNAKDYGIPQNRKRCFMISILGDYAYDFPCKIKLKYRLKDLLEKQVDEKYYLSQKMVDYITATNEKWTGNNGGAIVNKDIGCTINTAPGQRRCDASNYIADDLPDNTDLREVINEDTETNGGLLIKNATKQGYLQAKDGDGIDISSRMETHRGTVQKDSCQTLTCCGGENVGVVVEVDNVNKDKER